MLISNPVCGTTPPGIDEVSQEQVFKQMRDECSDDSGQRLWCVPSSRSYSSYARKRIRVGNAAPPQSTEARQSLMQAITVKLDYATMRFLKEMMKDIKEIKNNSRRSTRRHEDVSSVQRRSRVRSREHDAWGKGVWRYCQEETQEEERVSVSPWEENSETKEQTKTLAGTWMMSDPRTPKRYYVTEEEL